MQAIGPVGWITRGVLTWILFVHASAQGATITGNAVRVTDAFDVGSLSVAVSGPAGTYVRMGSGAGPVTAYGINSASYQLAITDTNYLPPATYTGRVTYTVSAPARIGTLFVRRMINATYQVSPLQVSLAGYGVITNLAGATDSVYRLSISTFKPPLFSTQLVHDVRMVPVTGYSANGEVYGEGPRGWQMTAEAFQVIPVREAGVTASVNCDWPSANAYQMLVRTNADGTHAGGDMTSGPYWDNTHNPGVEIYMDLGTPGAGDPYSVAGLLMYNRADHRPDLDIFTGSPGNWSASPVCHVQFTDAADSELIVLKFTPPVTTSHLKLAQAANQSFLLFQVLPLQFPPEKGTLITIR